MSNHNSNFAHFSQGIELRLPTFWVAMRHGVANCVTNGELVTRCHFILGLVVPLLLPTGKSEPFLPALNCSRCAQPVATDPSPMEIRRLCWEIQATWSPAEAQRRAGVYVHRPVEVDVVEVTELVEF
jgi:hypothetical protein